MKKKKPRIQIKDLDVNLEELKKISPEVLAKIRGGACAMRTSMINPPCEASGGCMDTFIFRYSSYRTVCF
jgi:hypothetical protein